MSDFIDEPPDHRAFVTILRSLDGKPANKRISIVKGQPAKKAHGNLGAYICQVVRADDPAALAAVLGEVGGRVDALLSLGFVPEFAPQPGQDRGPEFRAASRADVAKRMGLDPKGPADAIDAAFAAVAPEDRRIGGLPVVTRTLQFWRFGGWTLFDRDPHPDMSAEIRHIVADDDAFLAAMERIAPGISRAGRVRLRSSTGRVRWNGAALPAAGRHEYVRLDRPGMVGAVAEDLQISAVLAGLSWRKAARSATTGEVVATTMQPVWDPAVFSPERLVFCGAPDIRGAGLTLDAPLIEAFPGGTFPVAAVPDHDDDAREDASEKAGASFARRGSMAAFTGPKSVARDLTPDTPIDFLKYGRLTVAEAVARGLTSERAQVPDCFRSSTSLNAMFGRHGDDTPYLWDRGARVRHVLAVPAVPGEAPHYARPTMRGDVAEARLRRVVETFFNRVERCLAAREWIAAEVARTKDAVRAEIEARLFARLRKAGRCLDDAGQEAAERAAKAAPGVAKRAAKRRAARMPDFGRRAVGPMPSMQVAGSAGLGKTRAVIEEYLRRPGLWRHSIEIYAPTLTLAGDFADDVMQVIEKARAEAKALVAPDGSVPRVLTLQGRQAKGMCHPDRQPVVAAAIEAGVDSVYGTCCKTAATAEAPASVCPFHEGCARNGYIAQFMDKGPALRVMAHHRMPLAEPAELRLPDPVMGVVDENTISSLTDKAMVDPAWLTDASMYASEPGEEHLVQEAMDLGARIVATMTAPGNTLAALAATGTTPDLLRDAAKAATMAAEHARPKVAAGMDPSEAKKRLAHHAEHGRHHGRAVAALLRQVARDLDAGRAQSIGIEWDPKNTVPIKGIGMVTHPIFRLHFINAPKISSDAALLLIDADANLEVNRQIFRPELRGVTITAARHTHVIQISDKTMAKSSLAPDARLPNNLAKAATLRGKIANIARSVTVGRRVLFVAPLAVRCALTGENGGDGKVADYAPWMGGEITHYGRLIGRNRWTDYDLVVVIGREQLAPIDAERIARAVYANADGVTLNLTGNYPWQARRHDMRSGKSAPVMVQVHPDRRVQGIVEIVRERGMGQAIDRLRPVRRAAAGRDPVQVIVICDLPVPGLVVDELMTFNKLIGATTGAIDNGKAGTGRRVYVDRVDEAADRLGCLPLSRGVLWRLCSDKKSKIKGLWDSERRLRSDLDQWLLRNEQVAVSAIESHIADSATCSFRIEYTHGGGGHWPHAMISQPATEGVARLEAVLGRKIVEWKPVEADVAVPAVVEALQPVIVVDAPFFPPWPAGLLPRVEDFPPMPSVPPVGPWLRRSEDEPLPTYVFLPGVTLEANVDDLPRSSRVDGMNWVKLPSPPVRTGNERIDYYARLKNRERSIAAFMDPFGATGG